MSGVREGRYCGSLCSIVLYRPFQAMHSAAESGTRQPRHGQPSVTSPSHEAAQAVSGRPPSTACSAQPPSSTEARTICIVLLFFTNCYLPQFKRGHR